MDRRVQNIAGQSFNMLTAVEFMHASGGHAHWRFRCRCGTEKAIRAAHVKSGQIKSCGCSASDLMSAAKVTHGHWIGDQASPEWSAWSLARNRCRNPDANAYAEYGGRGIMMCSRWADGEAGKSGFECFLADMGLRPSPHHTLDRRENDKGYEPGNCRWVTMKEQGRNRRNNRLITYRGETMCVSEAAERYGIPYFRLINRIARGWPVERAIEEPSNR